ncbi:hypothetical protein [Phenylobacterium sp.]|uniref:hypothetical protein n=1 Tax=Phenylobacterium sp. TaxID=1871053 RepID=UPI002EDA2B7A
MRILLAGAALSLAAGLAHAQTPPAAPPGDTSVNPPVSATPPNPPAPPSTTAPTSPTTPGATIPPASDTTATTAPAYKTGATIKDAQGQVIGTIAKVTKTPDGATTVSAKVDGRTVNLPASALTLSADGTVVSSMSKAQITASTKPPA